MTTNPDYPSSRVAPGAMARLMTEDWNEMTAAANASKNHVASDDRWTRAAREANPQLSEDQLWRLGQKMKHAHFSKLGKLSVQARRK